MIEYPKKKTKLKVVKDKEAVYISSSLTDERISPVFYVNEEELEDLKELLEEEYEGLYLESVYDDWAPLDVSLTQKDINTLLKDSQEYRRVEAKAQFDRLKERYGFE